MEERSVNRRDFFAAIVAFIAGLFGKKALASLPHRSGWPDGWIPPAHEFYSYLDGGHIFHVWPHPPEPVSFFFDAGGKLWEFGPTSTKLWEPVGFPTLPQFHRHAFALVSDPVPFERDAPFTTEPSGNIGRDMKYHAARRNELAEKIYGQAYEAAAAGRPMPTAEEQEQAFRDLNAMLDRWSTEPWKV
jgi:hypothetical protein